MFIVNKFHPPPVCKLLEQGNLGVDIFFFVSGLGLVYSLRKKELSGDSLSKWYYTRFKRILIPYWFITGLCMIVSLPLNQTTVSKALSHLLLLSYWLTGNGAWFVSTLLILYLLSPFFYIVLHKNRNGIIYAIIVSMATMICCQNDGEIEGEWEAFMMGFVRTPSFFLGMATAKYVMLNKYIQARIVGCFAFFSLIIILALHVGFPQVYSKWMMILPLIIVLIFFIKKFKLTDSVALFFGGITLECYLFNIFLHYGVKVPIWVQGVNINYGNVFEYSMVLIVGTILAFYTHKFLSPLLKALN